MKRLLKIALALLYLAGPGAHAGGLLPPTAREVVVADFLGVNTPFLFFTPERYQKQIQALRALGLKWVRIDLHWYYLEPREGQFDWEPVDRMMAAVKAAGLTPVVYLVGSARFASTSPDGRHIDQWPPKDFDAFARRMVLLAQRYPFVRHWQIWNEPNIPSFWRPKADPQAYARLVAAVARAFRAAGLDDRQLVLGGMAYYSQMPDHGNALMLEALGNLGVFRLVDVVAYHPYTDTPEGDPFPGGEFVPRARILDARLRGAGVGQIWATEFGWSTYTGPKTVQSHIDEPTQGEYLIRRLVMSMSLGFDRIFWFALSDLDRRVPDRDRHYGLLYLDGRPKPSYRILRHFLDLLGPRLRPAPERVPEEGDDGLYTATWRRDDGRLLWFAWSPQGPRTVHLPVRAARAVVHRPGRLSRQAVSAENGRLAVELGPWLTVVEL